MAGRPDDAWDAALLALVGPTASGKSEAAVWLAERLGAEIVAVDAMTVYRGMDVGTAKPSDELLSRVPHHLLDVADPAEPFSVAAFQALASAAVAGIRSRRRRALLVGGSGLYYRAIIDGLRFPGTEEETRRLLEAEAAVVGPSRLHQRLAELDPAAAGRIPPSNVRRTVRALEVAAVTGVPFSAHAGQWDRFGPGRVVAAGVDLPRSLLHRRIERRVAGMMPRLLEETERLVALGFGRFLTASQAIGYAEAVACLQGRLTSEEAALATVKRTKTLARRQLSWFRRDPRIRWFSAGEGGAPEIRERLLAHLRGREAGAGGRSMEA